MDAVSLAAATSSLANLSGGTAIAAFKAQVDSQRALVNMVQALTTSGRGQQINMLV